MTALEIIAEVARLGVTLRVDGTDLVHRGPRRALDPPLIAALKAHKLAILAELRQGQAPGPVPCPSDVSERAALIAEDDQCCRREADNRALAEHGFPSWQALAAAHASAITAALQRLPAPSSRQGTALIALTARFVASHWFGEAIALGWPLIELFGIGQHAPVVRVDHQGLVTGLALSAFSGGRLIALEDDVARIQYPTGSVQTYHRGMPAIDASVIWWECTAIMGASDGF
jgi:hypothetical protein